MTFEINYTARNAACDALTALLDAGGAGSLVFRTGSQPATPETAASGTLLATCGLSTTAFGAAVTGVCTASPITSDTSVDASGTPGYFRLLDNSAVCIGQGSVGQGTGDISFDSTTWIAGGTVAISSLTITVPYTP